MTLNKILLLLSVIILVALIVIGYVQFFGTKTVAGTVCDCVTNMPLADATVTARQQGWGWNHYLVWDKNYWVTTRSDSSGQFALQFTHGRSANLWVTKAGYRTAVQYEYPAMNISVGMVAGSEHEFSQKCEVL